jgi:hypothetical protein
VSGDVDAAKQLSHGESIDTSARSSKGRSRKYENPSQWQRKHVGLGMFVGLLRDICRMRGRGRKDGAKRHPNVDNNLLRKRREFVNGLV